MQVVAQLEAGGHLTSSQLVAAAEATQDMLLDVHDAAYLHRLDTSSAKVAQVCTDPSPAWLQQAEAFGR